jgi:hypothetical protein
MGDLRSGEPAGSGDVRRPAPSAVTAEPHNEERVWLLQDVYRIGSDIDLKLLESFKESGFQADEELPVRLRVWHVYEQADEVLLIPLAFVHPDSPHGGR